MKLTGLRTLIRPVCVSLPMTIPAVPSWMVLNSAAESRNLDVLGEVGSVISIGSALAAVNSPVADDHLPDAD